MGSRPRVGGSTHRGGVGAHEQLRTSRGESAMTSTEPTKPEQWRDAAAVLREHAVKLDKLAGPPMCGVVLPDAGPNGEPLACAWAADHLPEKPHSWASLPSWTPREEGPAA